MLISVSCKIDASQAGGNRMVMVVNNTEMTIVTMKGTSIRRLAQLGKPFSAMG